MVGYLQLLLLDVSVKLFVVLTSEWELATQESKEEHAEGPDICGRPRVLDLAHDLRCHVRRCSAEDLDFSLMRDTSGEAEINQFHSLLCFI